MADSRGRRIKRSILIDQWSVRFCSEEEIARLRQIDLLDMHFKSKDKELDLHNKMVNGASIVNKRKLTNIGLFRAYIVAFLRTHPQIHQGMTLLVRQLQPNAGQGLPIQIYCFSSDTAWVNYEDIQSDIFDHLYAILPEFNLKPFQLASTFEASPTV